MGNSSFNSDNPTQLQVTENILIKAPPKALTTKYLQASTIISALLQTHTG